MLDPERTEVRRNGEWLDMPMEDLFRLARTTTVAQLLERDDFAKRYAAGEPISILELLYPLLQGYDSVAVEADVELGGTDQTFNLLLGRDVQQAYGVKPQSILTMPILPGTDGERKMSKSLGNYVGVTDPPEEMFGKLMSVPDEAMPVYYELLLDEPFDAARPAVESKRGLARSAGRPLPRRRRRPRPPRRTSTGCTCSARLRTRSRSSPSRRTARRCTCPHLLRDAFGISGSEGRRLLEQGGVKLDGEPLRNGDLDLPAGRLDGALLQVGKRRFKRLRRGVG